MQTLLSIQSCHYILSFSSEQDGYKTELVPFLVGGGGAYLYNQKGGLMCKAGKQCVSIAGWGESVDIALIHIDHISLCLFLRREIKTLEVFGSFINPG